MKLALYDIDRTLLECGEREKYANEWVEMITKRLHPYLENDPKLLKQVEMAVFYHKQTFYKPELVAKDTVMADAIDDIRDITKKGYEHWYLTSRPWDLYKTTQAQLVRHGFPAGDGLLCKHDIWKYTKTKEVWKPGMVHTFMHLLHPTDVIVVDDEEAVRKVIDELSTPEIRIRTFESMRAAVIALHS